jgi:hypothetical protein
LVLVAFSSVGASSDQAVAAGQLPLLIQPAGATAGSTADIPPVVYSAYLNAVMVVADEDGCELRPAILAGIGSVETGHGTYGGSQPGPDGTVTPPIIGIALDGTGGVARIDDTDNGAWDGDVVFDRAVGPMQFIPGTWRIYRADGNGDGITDPNNVFDAAIATARLLCTAGGGGDLNSSVDRLRDAVFAYNHSTVYVSNVMDRVAYYDTALAAPGGDPSALLANPNFTACQGAVTDLEQGLIDARVVAMLTSLAHQYELYVCPLQTGHYQCVGGGSRAERPACSESHHWHGRAVDISMVNGQAVTSANRHAQAIVEYLATMSPTDPARPAEIGSPWAAFSALPGFFSDSDHRGHLHLGWCGPRYKGGSLVDSCA